MTNIFDDGFDLELLLASGYPSLKIFERDKHENNFYGGKVNSTCKIRTGLPNRPADLEEIL